MKSKRIVIFLIVLIALLFTFIFVLLISNKTFFKNVYVGVQNQEIFIPKYSYFKEECCMTAAIFYSFKSEKDLTKEIEDYMSDFEYFDDDTTYGYRKGELFIQEYKVLNNGLYRKIVITY